MKTCVLDDVTAAVEVLRLKKGEVSQALGQKLDETSMKPLVEVSCQKYNDD